MKLKEILNLEKEDLDKKAREILKELSTISELQKLSIRDLCNRYSSGIDSEIIKFKNRNNFEYIGGEFIIKIHTKDKFYLLSNLYFKDKNDKFSALNMKSEIFNIDKLDPLSQKELMNNKELIFDVTP